MSGTAGVDQPSRAVLCRVTGRVQGVWYRSATAEQARRLGLSGSARNLDDGSVEVIARGTPEAVAELVEWLWQGSPMAEVRGVEVQPLAADEGAVPSGFVTG